MRLLQFRKVCREDVDSHTQPRLQRPAPAPEAVERVRMLTGLQRRSALQLRELDCHHLLHH